MPIFTKPNKNSTYSVDLQTLVDLSKGNEAKNQAIGVIADMQSKGEALLTMEQKVKVPDILDAQVNNSLLGVVQNHLNEKLPQGCYIAKPELDNVMRQFNEHKKMGVPETEAYAALSKDLDVLCKSAKKFNIKAIAREQIEKGKDGRSFELYRMDRADGLCITNVPRAEIAANRDEIVAKLHQALNQSESSMKHAGHGIIHGAKEFNGDAEHMSKATLHMTAQALVLVVSALANKGAELALKQAMSKGNVNINDVMKDLLAKEKQEMVAGMKNEMDEISKGAPSEKVVENEWSEIR